MNYLRLLKKLKSINYPSGEGPFDYGMDRIFTTCKKVYTFTYRNKPNSNANDIIHLMIKDREHPGTRHNL